MVQTKVITIKKRGGGTRRQAVEVLKSGKFKFIKNTSAKLKSKARTAGSKIKSKARKRSNTTKTNKPAHRSHRSMKGASLYPKKSMKDIAIKTAIGAGIGIAIRLATMFNRDRNIREAGFRVANVGSSYGGGGTGNLAFQGIDFFLARLISRNGTTMNGQISIPSPIIFGGA